ncbi:hypothetical protein L7F22_006239 [Adiantum nelumboides]|nr:hypothetical protein [Adiantum nelumboides]
MGSSPLQLRSKSRSPLMLVGDGGTRRSGFWVLDGCNLKLMSASAKGSRRLGLESNRSQRRRKAQHRGLGRRSQQGKGERSSISWSPRWFRVACPAEFKVAKVCEDACRHYKLSAVCREVVGLKTAAGDSEADQRADPRELPQLSSDTSIVGRGKLHQSAGRHRTW